MRKQLQWAGMKTWRAFKRLPEQLQKNSTFSKYYPHLQKPSDKVDIQDQKPYTAKYNSEGTKEHPYLSKIETYFLMHTLFPDCQFSQHSLHELTNLVVGLRKETREFIHWSSVNLLGSETKEIEPILLKSSRSLWINLFLQFIFTGSWVGAPSGIVLSSPCQDATIVREIREANWAFHLLYPLMDNLLDDHLNLKTQRDTLIVLDKLLHDWKFNKDEVDEHLHLLTQLEKSIMFCIKTIRKCYPNPVENKSDYFVFQSIIYVLYGELNDAHVKSSFLTLGRPQLEDIELKNTSILGRLSKPELNALWDSLHKSSATVMAGLSIALKSIYYPNASTIPSDIMNYCSLIGLGCQLVDDFQDIQEDTVEHNETLFTLFLSNQKEIEELCQATIYFWTYIIFTNDPQSKASLSLKEINVKEFSTLLVAKFALILTFDAVYQHRDLFSYSFISELKPFFTLPTKKMKNEASSIEYFLWEFLTDRMFSK